MLNVRKYLLLEFNRSMRSKFFHLGWMACGGLICVQVFFLLMFCTHNGACHACNIPQYKLVYPRFYLEPGWYSQYSDWLKAG